VKVEVDRKIRATFTMSGGAAKRQKVDDGGDKECERGPLPLSFLSLNLNGICTRLEKQGGQWLKGIANLVEEKDPDVIAFQEVKLTAKAPAGVCVVCVWLRRVCAYVSPCVRVVMLEYVCVRACMCVCMSCVCL